MQKVLEKWDAALLLLDKPVRGIKHLDLLAYDFDTGPEFRAYGFPEVFKFSWYNGQVQGPVSSVDKHYQVALQADLRAQLSGMSGAPVFLKNMYDVIGIFYWHDTKNLQSGRIVPTKGFDDKAFEDLLNSFEIVTPSAEPDDEPWCYVLRSESDRILEERRIRHTIRQNVKEAMDMLQNDPLVGKNKTIQYEYATDAINPKEYKKTLKKLCYATVAVFDITNYEPAMMLLLGVRSVVKRGITIASLGRDYLGIDYRIGDPIELPFNIKDLTIISHSKKQFDDKNQPAFIIRNKIHDGLNQLSTLPHYLDLPAFDAVRDLPPGHRERDTNNVLVLCPYTDTYNELNWKDLSYNLYLKLVEGAHIFRILDLISPRMVSPTIYEFIRRVALCIVDWTAWRPNVFFELGVRLAISDKNRFTVCIIDNRYKLLIEDIASDDKIEAFKKDPDVANSIVGKFLQITPDKFTSTEFKLLRDRYISLAEQCLHLKEIFSPLDYNPYSDQIVPDDFWDGRLQHDHSKYELMMSQYRGNNLKNEVASIDDIGLAPPSTYEVIQERIDPEGELACVPVYIELLRTAQMFGIDDTEARAAVLYPDNKELNRRVEAGIIQRLLAAWYYIRIEYKEKEEEIVNDERLFQATQQIGSKLYHYIGNVSSKQADEIDDFLQLLLKLKKEKGS